jgi:transposase
MQITHFIGIDVSKDTLDLTLIIEGKPQFHHCFANEDTSIKQTISSLLKTFKASFKTTVFCMEYTGIYTMRLLKWLGAQGAHIWMESGAHINKSQGLVRGKDDKTDSLRIARYAWTNREQVKIWQAPRPVIDQLEALLSLRERFVNAKKQLATALGEQQQFLDKATVRLLVKHNKKPTESLTRQILEVEKQILEIIRSDERLCQLYRLITSVDGIGLVTATYVLITTNEFISISDPKKFACYCGVVPFKHQSGTSVRGKQRVSHMANKKMKTLLHLAATTTLRMKGEMKQYYDRKVEEGKHKMNVINAIRNKLVHRIFACIRNNRPYEKNYLHYLAKP